MSVRRATGAVGLLLMASAITACGSGDDDGATAGACGPTSELRFGVHTEVRGFDVVNGGTVGVAGGHERSAVFDTLMEYDAGTGDFVPRMAESFEPNEDYTEWTLTLRDGITFNSGNPVTTEAVKFSVDRHGADDTVSLFKAQMDVIESMEVTSDLEMSFRLKDAQGDFPAVFATAPGMLADPAVFEEAGPEEFGVDPSAGAAGPYKVASYTQGEEVVLTRNEDYWGEGEFCIGTLRFVYVEDEEARRDSFLNGELDMAYFNDASVIDAVRRAPREMHTSIGWGAATVLINHGTGGVDRPGKDVRVRKAIAHALDPEVIDDRATGGTGVPSTALVTDESILWSEGLEGPAHDPAEASSLLAQAKADGYDGKITLSCDNAPAKVEWALTVEAMLEKIGFDVTLENSRSLTDHRELFFTGNYDLSCFAMSVDESLPWVTFQTTLGQDTVAQSRVGYRSPAMGRAMDELRAAGTVEERQAALFEMQAIWNEDVPMAITAHGRQGLAWNEGVEGVQFRHAGISLFDDATIDR
ncbi:ABC transporter substrate-binding protein [Nocardioides marmotae]|nr:ABC transporter substrate-binding protein [Nocardioides marmotae]